MLDDLKEEGIVNKVGGRFKLSTLIQKRMVALNTGAKPQIDLRNMDKSDKLAIVLQEILQDKIFLDASGNMHENHHHNPNLFANLPGAYPGAPNQAPMPMPAHRSEDD